MNTRAACLHLLSSILLVAAAWAGAARAGEPSAVMLVATPELGAAYSHTILVAQPVAHGRHIGVIVNRPTRLVLAALFPDHAPSKKVADPVYFGGPVAADALFALVHASASPGEGALQLAPDLFFAADGAIIDRIIEHHPERARFFAGVVVWEPGELAAEIEQGFWLVRPAEAALALRKRTEGMWEELVRRPRQATALR